MLVGEGEVFDLETVVSAAETIEKQADGVRRELAVEPSAESLEALGPIRLNLQLTGQLTRHRLDDVAPAIVQPDLLRGQLLLLVAAWHRQQTHGRLVSELSRSRGTDIALVAEHGEASLPGQEPRADGQIRLIGRGQHEVENDPIQGNEQMQFVAEDSLLFALDPAKGGAIGLPGSRSWRARHQVKTQDRDRQTVDGALAIEGEVEVAEQMLAHAVDRAHEIAPSAVEAAAFREHGEEVGIIGKGGNELGFVIPAPALADQDQRDQFAITTVRWGTGPHRGMGEQEIIDEDVDSETEVGKAGYHQTTPSVASGRLRYRIDSQLKGVLSIYN